MGSKKKQKNEKSNEPVIKKIEDQSLDDFLDTWADSDGEDEEKSVVSVPSKEEKKKTKKKKKSKSEEKEQGHKDDVKVSVQSEEAKKKSKKNNKSIETEQGNKNAISDGKIIIEEKKKKKKMKSEENDKKSKDDAKTEVKLNVEGKERKKKLKKKLNDKEKEQVDDSDTDSEEEEEISGARDQSAYLARLKDKDPEFYDFLKENDQELLDFNESSDGEDEDDDAEEEKIHKLPDKLEVASDESDAEEDEEEEKTGTDNKSKKKLKQAHLDAWTAELEKQPNLGTIGNIISAFRGAVATIGADDEEQENTEYIVEGGILFNGVVRMCVVSLQPALKSVLKISPDDSHYKPEKAKNWKKVQRHVKLYLLELCKLMARIVEPAVVTVLLKHVHQMIPFFQAFQKGAKQVLQRLVSYWCQGEETVRILSFMCVVKLVRGTPLLETALKQMYMAYVRNCKFTSPSSLPLISFMRRSLVELMGLDHNLSYYHAFVYIRQLAIHLRNAITTNKKDAVQAVYNWQFIHSLELWGALLGHTSSSDALQPLIYPLVQVILGTTRLIATPKYFPLRFHCCKVLTALSRSTGTFIPVLPFYLDVLNTFNFNKKSTKVSMKPIDFSCILKLSKSQMVETGFKDSTMAEIQAGLLAYLSDNSSKIGFPELVTPAVFQLKAFNKKCKVANYTKKIKQVLEKITANQKFIETRRKTVKFSVADKDDIAVWEASVERDGTPLLAFYKSWNKTREIQHLKKMSEQEKMDDYSHIPNLKKNHKKIRMKKETLGGDFLDGDDSGDDSFDEEEQFKLKEERGKGEKRKHEESDNSDLDDDEDDGDVKENAASTKPKQTNAKLEKTAEESDHENDSDVVEDLKLDDLDSDSEMDDEFDVSKNDADSGSDEESEDEN